MSSVPKLLLWVFGDVKRNVMKSHSRQIHLVAGQHGGSFSVHSMVITLLPYSCVYFLIKMMTGWGNEWVWNLLTYVVRGLNVLRSGQQPITRGCCDPSLGLKVYQGSQVWMLSDLSTYIKLQEKSWLCSSDGVCQIAPIYLIISSNPLRDLMFSAYTHILCHLHVRVYESCIK